MRIRSESLRTASVLFASVLSGLMLTACDPFARPDSLMDEYVKRVGRVLDVEPHLSPVPVAPELPRRRDRVRSIPELHVGMLDFLGLYGCELQHVVAERNSSLGRVMHPSSRLDYELRFLRAADDCIERIDREGLAERIVRITESKRETLPDAAWNAVWGTREIEQLFTRSRGALRVDHDRNAVSEMQGALHLMDDIVHRIVGGELEVDISTLDAVYQRWLRQPLLGQTIASAILVSTRLDDAAALIEARLGDRPLCHKGMRNRRADTMQNMFHSVYAGHVQPYLAQVQRARQDLLPPIRDLARIPGPGATSDLDDYFRDVVWDNEHGWWSAFDRAIQRHTRAWQALLDQCGMRPGREDQREG